MNGPHISRRDAIRAGLAAGAGILASRDLPLHAATGSWSQQPLITRAIPTTGEELPVVGLGTNRFSTTEPERIAVLREVLRTLSDRGGKVVDTARGYGRAEEVIGGAVKEIGNRDKLFIATKYSIRGGRGAQAADAPNPRAGLDEAFTRLQMTTIDLMMVHNLGGTDTLMPVMQEMKQEGRFRYLGASTSSDRQYEGMVAAMKTQPFDFIQVDYSIGNRTAAEQILPLAADRGMAVLINVPFGGRRGSVFSTVGDRPVPDWAAEIGCQSWAQVFLKYIVSHAAVTTAIPGTTNPEHLIDNLGACRGQLPDAAMRKRIEEFFDAL